MPRFVVYRHSMHGYEAVKEGFSWPALFFTFIWAFLKGLWLQGLAFLIVVFALTMLENAFAAEQNEVGLMLVLFGEIVSFLVFGLYGNRWRIAALQRRGYEFQGRLEAQTPQAAIAAATSDLPQRVE